MEAEFGEIRKIRNHLLLHVSVLGVGLLVMFFIVLPTGAWSPIVTFMIFFSPLAIWFMASHTLLRVLRGRAARTLDSMLENLQEIGRK